MIRAANIWEERRMALATPVEPVSVSFAPSKAPEEWSVTVDDVRPSDSARTRNREQRFREGGR